jgi:hypothetical protein
MAGANLLSQAIARNSSVAVGLVTPDGMRHHRSRFLRECADGFWIESIQDERTLIDEIIGAEQKCSLSFVAGPRKLLFACPIYLREPAFVVNPGLTCEALLLPFPTEPREIQRRERYRARLGDDMLEELRLQIWQIAEQVDLDDKPMRSQLISARPRDISATGIGLVKSGELASCVAGQRMRIEMAGERGSVLVEGRARFVTDQSARFPRRLGVAFTGLDESIAGRKLSNQIGRLVATVERDELRRLRREMATDPLS